MGLIKAGLILYGAHLAAKNIYGEKKQTSTEGSWCHRSEAPLPGGQQAPQGLQGPPPNYAPSNNSQDHLQQWQEKAAIESRSAPKECTCGAASSNHGGANYSKN